MEGLCLVSLVENIVSSRKSQFRAFSNKNLGFPDAVQTLQSARQLQEVGVGRNHHFSQRQVIDQVTHNELTDYWCSGNLRTVDG